ncbi:MAG TPA: hypothetical protein VFT66_17385 [Roseiflexaceae bacterium]|nr:hypothetical protein [Roseiflexaceae bacterium]
MEQPALSDEEFYRDLLQAYKRRLEKLLLVQAHYGIDCPPHIANEIDEINDKVTELENNFVEKIHKRNRVLKNRRTYDIGFYGTLQDSVYKEIIGSAKAIFATTTLIIVFLIILNSTNEPGYAFGVMGIIVAVFVVLNR